jgi:hypothetical protein
MIEQAVSCEARVAVSGAGFRLADWRLNETLERRTVVRNRNPF